MDGTTPTRRYRLAAAFRCNSKKDVQQLQDDLLKFYGSCLCGDVEFEVHGTFDSFLLCHCVYCQKDTGSAHAANLFSANARLRWLSGETQVTSFTLPGTRHTRSFCSGCGSALPIVQDNGEQLAVPAGSIDTDVPIEPIGHIFMSSKANWDDHLERIRTFDGLPDL